MFNLAWLFLILFVGHNYLNRFTLLTVVLFVGYNILVAAVSDSCQSTCIIKTSLSLLQIFQCLLDPKCEPTANTTAAEVRDRLITRTVAPSVDRRVAYNSASGKLPEWCGKRRAGARCAASRSRGWTRWGSRSGFTWLCRWVCECV